MNTFAYPLPIGYQNLINSLIKHMLKDVVSGLSRRKQGFDSPWGYLFYKELSGFSLPRLANWLQFGYNYQKLS